MHNYWRGKVVLITGGSTGLGYVLAGQFAAAGARVVIAARDNDRLQAAAKSLRMDGGDVFGRAADITDDKQVSQLIAEVVDRCQGLDALVNNAGRSTRGQVTETTVDEFESLLQLNFLAAVRCTNAALPHLLSRQGHLVHIASLATKAATRYLGAYPASKAPLGVYAQQLRLELQPQGVHVLLVCPGPIARDDAGQRYNRRATDLPEAARKPGGGVRLKGIPPEKLAKQIMTACERRRAELIVPRKARFFFALSSLCAECGDAILRRMTR